MTNLYVQQSALGITVRIQYDLNPDPHPDSEADIGPYLKDGSIAITAGTSRVRSLFSLVSIGVGAPTEPQALPSGPKDGCGSPGPITIEPLPRYAYPFVSVWTMVVGKGCYPVMHVFVPLSDTSKTYVGAQFFDVARNPGVFHSDGTLRVGRVRIFTIPKPAGVPFVPEYRFAVVEGRDASGRPMMIALSSSNRSELPYPGETITVFQTRLHHAFPFVELSASHKST